MDNIFTTRVAGGRGRKPNRGRLLAGKTIFLDVRGPTRTIERELKSFGGKIEPSLGRNVDFVITNRCRIQQLPRAGRGRRSDSRQQAANRSRSSKAQVRSYAVGLARKWGIPVHDLEDVKKWLSQNKTGGTSWRAYRKPKASQQLSQSSIKVADRKRKSRPAAKQSSARPHLESTPGAGHQSAPSPPRTRSGGRRGNGRGRPGDGSSPVSQSASVESKAPRTRRAAAGRRSSASPVTETTPPRRHSQTTAATKLQSVQFNIVKIPPAIEMIPKAKPLKKAHVTMKKVKRQLIFDDIAPSPITVTPTARTFKPSKKLIVLKELQDRLDGLGSPTSPPMPASRQQPGRRKKAATPPKNVTVARLARQLKKELQDTSPQITRMSLRNGKVKFAGH
ncbi:uncharacterized protein [Diadema setosum]|uniref:uncharacterized protein n=1 Tax=Diadema setosum TaxID=31175 RepID=UPI003B3B8FAE